MNWPLLQNSLLLAGTTAALAIGFGLIAALWLATLGTRWRTTFLALAIVVLALPPFLVTNCWISLLGDNGVLRAWLPFGIYSLEGTIWILSLMLWPITLFAALSAWRRLEAAQFECEPAMTGFALLRWLLLPVARGELALAAVVTFVLALNNFAVPAILQTKVLPDEMWVRFNTQFDTLGALKLSLPLVIAPLFFLAAASRRAVSWPRILGPVVAPIIRRQLGLRWCFGCGSIAVLVFGLSAVLPLAQSALVKRTWAELPGALEAGTGAIWNSFSFGALAATVVVAVGVVLSMRTRQFSPVISSLSWLSFLVPGVLLGIALIHLFNNRVLGWFYQSAGILVLAFMVRYFALGWTSARHAINSVDSDLTDVARLEGASRWQLMRFVVWPQIGWQVFAAWYVVYLFCLWDVESIVVIVPPGGETLALRIFNLLHYGRAAQVNALCVMLLGLAVAPLLIVAAFAGTRQFLSRRLLASAAALVLVTGCEPDGDKNTVTLPSKLFERAQTIGSRGVGIGELNKPRSVAVDLQDNVYAVDMTGRVQKFSPDGKYSLSWQMPQTDLGKPKGMGRDHDGNIVVVEPHYQRVNHFTPEGKLVAQWGCRGANEGCFILPRGIAENSHGEFLVSEYMGAERVQRFSIQKAEAGTQKSETGNLPQQRESNSTNWPYAKADAPLTSRSPQPAGLELGAAQRDTSLQQVIGRAGTAAGEFNRAEGICVDAQDRLYVADSCNHRIQIFSSDGKFLRAFGHAGTRLGELSYPYDVAVDKAGNIFVCEFGNSRIQVFDANCEPVEIIGRPGAAPGQFANPWGVALDSHGNLFVADALNHRVQKLVRRMGTVGQMRPMRDLVEGVNSRNTQHATR